jgi:hypothetical protein
MSIFAYCLEFQPFERKFHSFKTVFQQTHDTYLFIHNTYYITLDLELQYEIKSDKFSYLLLYFFSSVTVSYGITLACMVWMYGNR